jgi:large subunit ribosomal protein L25
MNIKIEAITRNNKLKSDLTKLRNDGFIPAIIYGEGEKGTKIAIKKIEFQRIYGNLVGETAFYDITVDGKTYSAFLKEKQIHPVTREFTHLDFLELHKGKTITLEIPINYVGEAPGVHAGGLMDVLKRSIEISCLPKDVPEEIEVDISKLNIGDSIHFADINLSDKLETSMTDVTTLVAIRAPKQEVEEQEEEISDAAISEDASEVKEENTEQTES